MLRSYILFSHFVPAPLDNLLFLFSSKASVQLSMFLKGMAYSVGIQCRHSLSVCIMSTFCFSPLSVFCLPSAIDLLIRNIKGHDEDDDNKYTAHPPGCELSNQFHHSSTWQAVHFPPIQSFNQISIFLQFLKQASLTFTSVTCTKYSRFCSRQYSC